MSLPIEAGWDGESYCAGADDCHEPATHERLVGVTVGGTPITVLVCAQHVDAGDAA